MWSDLDTSTCVRVGNEALSPFEFSFFLQRHESDVLVVNLKYSRGQC